MNQALLSKLAAEPNTPFPFGTVQAEIPESSPAAVAISSVQGEIAEEDLAGRGRDIGHPTSPCATEFRGTTYPRSRPY
jgi:hypothetical protein